MGELGWASLETQGKCFKLILFFKMLKGLVPRYISSLCPPSTCSNVAYNLRNAGNIRLLPTRLVCYQRSFLPSVVKSWNELPTDLRMGCSLNMFKSNLKKCFIPLKSKGSQHYAMGLEVSIKVECEWV